MESGRKEGTVQNAARCTSCSFLCAVCRILCYTCARRSCPCCFGPRPRTRTEVSILVLGLQGAGKTTLLATVAGEQATSEDGAPPSPTMGFAFKTVNVEEHLTLNFQELGGSEQIRMYWDRYYACKHLVVYVVDSCSSEEELGESGEAFVHCLSSPSLSGLPLLLVCSKQDLPTTRSITEIRERLRVGEIEGERNVAVISSSHREQQATRDKVIDTILQLLDTHTESIY